MNVTSLGYRMDLGFQIPETSVHDRGNYLVISTPSIPTYYYGNYVLFENPPGPGDLARWREIFAHEFAAHPAVEHEVFGWDAPDGTMGETQPFIDAGFEEDRDSVMVADTLQPPTKGNADIIVEPIETEAQWHESMLCYASSGQRVTEPNERVRRNMAHWKRLAARGDAVRYGAMLSGELVAGLGIYRMDDYGIVENVVTYEQFRRRGIGSRMVYEACVDAMGRLDVSRLDLGASEGGVAERMYETIGFRVVETQVGVSRT